jgi:hypothetical protein
MSESVHTSAADQQSGTYGVLGAFATVDALVKAARVFRDAGYKRWDVYSPFPIHGIDRAMGTRPTKLPWVVLIAGLTGMTTGILLTIFTMATEFGIPFIPGAGDLIGFPYLISGKPLNSLPAWIPVIFELTILFSVFGAVFGMFLMNRLPLLYNPLFKSEMFRRATNDRFFIGVDARDKTFDLEKTQALLQEQGALRVEVLEK